MHLTPGKCNSCCVPGPITRRRSLPSRAHGAQKQLPKSNAHSINKATVSYAVCLALALGASPSPARNVMLICSHKEYCVQM
eukprot:1158433-Pelagomonas_calceolata.AAC.20